VRRKGLGVRYGKTLSMSEGVVMGFSFLNSDLDSSRCAAHISRLTPYASCLVGLAAFLLVSVMACAWVGPVWGQRVTIDITQPSFERIPIAIPDFKRQTAEQAQLAREMGRPWLRISIIREFSALSIPKAFSKIRKPWD